MSYLVEVNMSSILHNMLRSDILLFRVRFEMFMNDHVKISHLFATNTGLYICN